MLTIFSPRIVGDTEGKAVAIPTRGGQKPAGLLRLRITVPRVEISTVLISTYTPSASLAKWEVFLGKPIRPTGNNPMSRDLRTACRPGLYGTRVQARWRCTSAVSQLSNDLVDLGPARRALRGGG